MPDYLESVRVRSRKRVCVATVRHVVGVIASVICIFGLAARPSVGDKRHADLCRWCGDGDGTDDLGRRSGTFSLSHKSRTEFIRVMPWREKVG